MEEIKKYYRNLIFLLLINVSLLVMTYLPNIITWNTESSDFIWDLLGLIWPIIGISIIIEFTLGDKWGWGGILFTIFTLYCGIYYSILTIIDLFLFKFELQFFVEFIIKLIIGIIGIISYFYYYD